MYCNNLLTYVSYFYIFGIAQSNIQHFDKVTSTNVTTGFVSSGNCNSVIQSMEVKVHEIKGGENTYALFQRLSIEILLELRNLLGFRIHSLPDKNGKIKIQVTANSSFQILDNPRERGIIEGWNDLSISNIVPADLINDGIIPTVDILHPIFSFSKFGIIFQQPSIRWTTNIQLLSFTPKLWFGILISLFLIHVFLLNCGDGKTTAIFMMMANIAQQGSTGYKTAKFHEKFAYFLGIVISMFYFYTYSANLYAIIYKSRIPISSFEDLLKFKYTFVNHESSQAGWTLLASLIKKHDLHQGFVSTSTEKEIEILIGQPNALLSHFEFFHKVARSQKYNDDEICQRFTWIKVDQRRDQCWIIRKNFPLRKSMNTKLTFLRERGIIHRLYKMAAAESFQNELSCPEVDRFSSVTLEESFLAFIILLVGILLSIFLLVVQSLVYNFINK